MRKQKVTQIELSDKHIGLRIVLVIVFLAIGVAGIFFGVRSCAKVPEGWTVIKANVSDDNCSNDFSFNYNLGKANVSTNEEKVILQNAFADYTVYTFREFNADTLYDNTKNIAYINNHPNEDVKVSNLLYKSLKAVVDNNSSYLFYAPIYYEYEVLLTLKSEDDIKSLDPNYSTEQAEYFTQIANYVNSGKVSLSILENNTVRLNVSDDYLAFIKEKEITRVIDFFRLKNAFIADFMAENLRDGGFKNGFIASIDGYVVNLGTQSVSSIFTKLDGTTVKGVGTYNLDEPVSMIIYRSYPYLNNSLYHYYPDGNILSTYINKEGRYTSATDTFFVYSNNTSVAEMALKTYYIYTNDTLDLTMLDSSYKYSYVEDNKFITNDDRDVVKVNDGFEKVVK